MGNIHFTNEVLFKNFKQLEVEVVSNQNAVWLYFNSQPRSCFTQTLLDELDKFQSILKQHAGKLPCNGKLVDINFNVITSRHHVFSFGGDLDFFVRCITEKNENALRNYARSCIDAVYYNYIGRELGLTTISLVHGNALGGGFEAALSSHVLIAEENAEMGFPEILFNLFPGMGAFNLLLNRVNPSTAKKMMMNGCKYDARELFDMGIVDILVNEGEGKLAVDAFIQTNRKRNNAITAITKATQLSNTLDYQKLLEIGDLWVDTAFRICEKDLRIMNRLINSQDKIATQVNESPFVSATAY